MGSTPEHHSPVHSTDEKPEHLSDQVSSAAPLPGSGSTDLDPGRHLLGPHVVGSRVVVRRLVPGETGPTGGPAFTDTLGTCLDWSQGRCVLQREDGSTVTVPWGLIVSGKPVPPRPSVRMRLDAATMEDRVADLWPDTVRTDLAGWTGRVTPPQDGRLRRRANSAAAFVEPRVPVAEAALLVRDFYAGHGRPPLVHVEAGSGTERALVELGWRPTGSGSAHLLVGPLSRVARRAAAAASHGPVPELTEDGTRAWASTTLDGTVVARGRVVLSPDGDLAGVADLWVAPHLRRSGLASGVLAELTDWAASRGARTLWLHVETDNAPALALYESLGLQVHHTARYLTADDSGTGAEA